jgi:uncharacterized membrane protein
MRFSLKTEWILIVIILGMFVATWVVLPQLPDPMPIHWNAVGQPDDFASRWIGAFMLPLVSLGLYLVMLLVPAIDPRRENYARFADTYHIFRLLLISFMAFVHGATLFSVLRAESQLNPDLVMVAVGLLFVLLGNYIPRIRSNWFVGIRTPWTLSDPEVWRRTHRLGGRAFFVAGLIVILAALLPSEWMMPALLSAIAVAAIVPTVYSYVAFRQLKREN